MAAIAQTVSRFMPTLGFPDIAPNAKITSVQSTANALTQTNSVTLALPKPWTGGLVRFRFYAPGDNTTTAQFLLEGTDGTTLAILTPPTAAVTLGVTTAGAELEFVSFWITELTQIATVTAVVTLGGTTKTGTLDFEIFGN